mmetsp:Transcript_24972/g.62313  ORF Transcript_24972/g.62313 Transcript_24972/m.62313 type:complete len:269 (+) Transcript_24972:2798-3604(+)
MQFGQMGGFPPRMLVALPPTAATGTPNILKILDDKSQREAPVRRGIVLSAARRHRRHGDPPAPQYVQHVVPVLDEDVGRGGKECAVGSVRDADALTQGQRGGPRSEEVHDGCIALRRGGDGDVRRAQGNLRGQERGWGALEMVQDGCHRTRDYALEGPGWRASRRPRTKAAVRCACALQSVRLPRAMSPHHEQRRPNSSQQRGHERRTRFAEGLRLAGVVEHGFKNVGFGASSGGEGRKRCRLPADLRLSHLRLYASHHAKLHPNGLV